MDKLAPDTTLALLQATQADASSASKKLKSATNARQLEKIEAAAQDFEAVFISEMMKPMFEGISTEAPFGGGRGEEVFRGMMLQEYGKLIAQTGSIGVADQVKQAMIEMQGLDPEILNQDLKTQEIKTLPNETGDTDVTASTTE